MRVIRLTVMAWLIGTPPAASGTIVAWPPAEVRVNESLNPKLFGGRTEHTIIYADLRTYGELAKRKIVHGCEVFLQADFRRGGKLARHRGILDSGMDFDQPMQVIIWFTDASEFIATHDHLSTIDLAAQAAATGGSTDSAPPGVTTDGAEPSGDRKPRNQSRGTERSSGDSDECEICINSAGTVTLSCMVDGIRISLATDAKVSIGFDSESGSVTIKQP